jgi:hypothetical protein
LSNIRVFGFEGGLSRSLNDDRTQDTPVWLAGVEEGSDPVVPEIAKAEADPLDSFDQVVE